MEKTFKVIGIIVLIFIVFYSLGKYTNIFSSVVFDDYNEYDNRVNKPYFVENWFSAYDYHPRGIYGNWFPSGCSSSSSNTCIPTLEDSKWYFELKRTPQGSDLLISQLLSEGNYVYSLYPASTKCGSPGGSYPCQGSARAIATENFLGKDVKITIECGDNSEASCNVILGKLDKSSKKISSIYSKSISRENSLTLEIFSSKLNPRVADIFVNGVFDKTISFEDSWSIGFEANKGELIIKSFGYKIPFSCNVSNEELLIVESFAGERTLSLYDLRYKPTKFCLAHPAIITSSTEKGSTTTAEVYQILAKGNIYTIPKDQTLTMFYIAYNDGSLPQTCGKGYYDTQRKKCVNITGIVQLCSEGTFDATLGACVVTPEIKAVCPYGRLENNICVWNPPSQAICEKGEYNSVSGKCEYFEQGELIEIEPLTKINCPPTYSFNPKSGYCEKNGDLIEPTTICPEGAVLVNQSCVIYEKPKSLKINDWMIYIIIGLVMVVLFLILRKK